MEAKANNIWEEEQEKSNAAANQSQFQRLLSIGQVAEILTVSVRTVWRLVAAQALQKPVLVGASRRWLPSDVQNYIEKIRKQRDGKIRRQP